MPRPCGSATCCLDAFPVPPALGAADCSPLPLGEGPPDWGVRAIRHYLPTQVVAALRALPRALDAPPLPIGSEHPRGGQGGQQHEEPDRHRYHHGRLNIAPLNHPPFSGRRWWIGEERLWKHIQPSFKPPAESRLDSPSQQPFAAHTVRMRVAPCTELTSSEDSAAPRTPSESRLQPPTSDPHDEQQHRHRRAGPLARASKDAAAFRHDESLPRGDRNHG
jgi:hypothetical protein